MKCHVAMSLDKLHKGNEMATAAAEMELALRQANLGRPKEALAECALMENGIGLTCSALASVTRDSNMGAQP